MGSFLSTASNSNPSSEPKIPVSYATQPKSYPPKKQLKINKFFIPQTIPDPQEGDPCAILIDGVNKFWEIEKFQKFIQKRDIHFTKAIKKKNSTYATLYFDNKEDRADAYSKIISSGDETGRYLFAVPLHRNFDLSKRECEQLRLRSLSDLDTRNIDNKIAPWNSIPYDEQLARKSAKFTEILRPILPEPVSNIHIFPAPKQTAYRNKIELNIGHDLNGEVCVGFSLGSRIEDIMAPIKSTINSPERAPEIAEKLRQFVVETGLPVFNKITNQGTWKFCLMRTNEAGEIMLMMVIYGKVPTEVIDAYKRAFENEVASLYFCETDCFEGYGPHPNIIFLSGKQILIQELRGLKFEISPLSFFQVNATGAELLFSKIEELAYLDENTLLLDICCGTGVIGLSMARKVKMVVGVDIEEQAIEDARRNAALNGITNAEYIAGKAENEMRSIIEKYVTDPEQRVVAIVDPPRAGLVKGALIALRQCQSIKSLIYVSCNADSLVNNATKQLCNERGSGPAPFQPVRWFGVDMFPQTDRCEIVMLMQRS